MENRINTENTQRIKLSERKISISDTKPYAMMESTYGIIPYLKISHYISVEPKEYAISKEVMVSSAFKFCQALILKSENSNEFGFAHILSGDSPDLYLENIMTSMGKNIDEGGVKAVVIKSGNEKTKLISLLESKKIPINCIEIPLKDETHANNHDVIVVPELSSVIIVTENDDNHIFEV